jgi:glycosyltransferase involved in cell wall biosynthesis
MRLLHVVPTYLPATRYGGPIYSVHALCAALARRGHDVHVFTTNVDGPHDSDVPLGVAVPRDDVNVWYFATSTGRRLYRSPTMGRALAERIEGFDTLHLHSVFLWPTSMAASVARRKGVPYVLAPRGMLVADLIRRKSRLLKQAWIAALDRRNLAHAAAVHVTSEIERDEIVALKLPARRFAVVPNGIELPPRDIERAATSPGTGRSRTVLALGRLSWKKGLDRLIPAMALVPDARLVIAGNDDEGYRPQLEAIAEACGVLDRIAFTGPVTGRAKWDLIATADVLALPSYSENFGNVVLEAMACGTPVVVTPEVGLAATVAEVSAGIVATGTPDAIGAAIARLLASPDERARMGAAGRRAAADRFSWDAIAASMEAHYEAARSTRRNGTDVIRRGPREAAGAQR